jgi:hypothetical protein
MKTLTYIAIALMAGFIFANAQGQGDSARPASIPEDRWIPITNTLGFVVVTERTTVQPRIDGYFVAWRNGGWRRLETMTEGGIYKLN